MSGQAKVDAVEINFAIDAENSLLEPELQLMAANEMISRVFIEETRDITFYIRVRTMKKKDLWLCTRRSRSTPRVFKKYEYVVSTLRKLGLDKVKREVVIEA